MILRVKILITGRIWLAISGYYLFSAHEWEIIKGVNFLRRAVSSGCTHVIVPETQP